MSYIYQSGIHFIDSYSYCKDYEKDDFFRRHKFTDEESKKTNELMNKLDDYIVKTRGENGLKKFHCSDEGKIKYINPYGYISVTNHDRDEVNVYGYGNTVEEVFIPILMDYEFWISEGYEWSHRQELNKKFSERFLNGEYSENDYHGPFFFAELALQDFRQYYGDNLPQEIISKYENYLKEVGEGNYKYDFEANCFVKNAEKANTLSKKLNTNK